VAPSKRPTSGDQPQGRTRTRLMLAAGSGRLGFPQADCARVPIEGLRAASPTRREVVALPHATIVDFAMGLIH
jgi:hypothetical protein